MIREKRLIQRIDDLLAQTRRAKNAAEMARFRYDTACQHLPALKHEAERLEAVLAYNRQQWREAVFELMVSVSHRRFMRFLKDIGG